MDRDTFFESEVTFRSLTAPIEHRRGATTRQWLRTSLAAVAVAATLAAIPSPAAAAVSIQGAVTVTLEVQAPPVIASPPLSEAVLRMSEWVRKNLPEIPPDPNMDIVPVDDDDL